MSEKSTRRAVLSGTIAAAALGASASGSGASAAAAPSGPARAGGAADASPRPESARGAEGAAAGALTPPLEFGYFRTWHDKHVDPSRPNSLGEVPEEIDLVFVFSDYTPDDSPFWGVLRDEYVPALHARGTRVVRTTDIRAVLDPAFPDTAAGHRENAEHLVSTLVDAHGLDGLDIDMERSLSAAETARAVGVFHELSRLIGPQSGTDRLFVYDTNRDGDVPLFTQTADCIDYVLVQSYGRSIGSLEGTWRTFAPHIAPEQYLIGFSFYEENDPNGWDDTSEPFEDSRAVAYADWQPEGTTKGGIFSYAIDRDGVAFRDDEIHHTTYEWSKKLKHRMLDQA